MNFQNSETTPDTILRLTDVIGMTGHSRSTLYNRIARREFPHQVSLGIRAVGWLKREVEDWIGERIRLRPGSTTGISDSVAEAPIADARSAQGRRSEIQRSPEPITRVLAVNECSPYLDQLHLVNTNLYLDRKRGSFWPNLLSEGPACRGRSPRARIQDLSKGTTSALSSG
jgi:prophage regulatory protein